LESIRDVAQDGAALLVSRLSQDGRGLFHGAALRVQRTY
jgi:hypothetical protein